MNPALASRPMRALDDPGRIVRAQLAAGQASMTGQSEPDERVRRFIERSLYVQYDPISTVAPSHVITTFARDQTLALHDVGPAYEVGNDIVEGWLRVACFLARDDYLSLGPEYARRRAGPLRYGERVRVGEGIHDLAKAFLAAVEDIGPATARDVVAHLNLADRTVGTWKSSVGRTVLNYLWYRGKLTITSRTRGAGMEPAFDLVTRVFPDSQLGLDDNNTAAGGERLHQALVCDLVIRQLRALVAATASELAWYLGQSAVAVHAAVATLERHQAITSFTIPASKQLYYCTCDDWAYLNETQPGQASGNQPEDDLSLGSLMLLSPFDPVLAHRDRFERLTGVTFRADLFTAQQDRAATAFYPLMLLRDGVPLGKLWVKADRPAKRLQRLDFQPFAADTQARRETRDHAHTAADRLGAFLGLRYLRRNTAPTMNAADAKGREPR